MITLQQIFNLAWQKFIIEQAPPAMSFDRRDREFRCEYVTKDGSRCAVGLAIPVEQLTYEEQTVTFPSLVDRYPEWFDASVCANYHLREFQASLHDDLASKETGQWKFSNSEMADMYRVVAENFNLTVPSGS